MESLKKECERAKKKCKDAQEKYFSESDRLKAIIELCQLRNELAEMKKSAQASTVSKLNSSTLTRFTSPFPPEFYFEKVASYRDM